jgi:hypothetical protein
MNTIYRDSLPANRICIPTGQAPIQRRKVKPTKIWKYS